MTCYPVMIPTLNRYSHLKNCVESLAKCTYADKTEVVIGLDYPPSEKYREGYLLTKEYIKSIKGFGKITVFEHKKNLGPNGNWKFLANYCCKHYDAYIATEDDNVFSPCFLDYMNQMLNRFKNDEKIVSVSGYNNTSCYEQNGYSCYLSKDNTAWGTGYWRHKEKVLQPILANRLFFEKCLYWYFSARKIFTTYPYLYLMLDVMIKNNLTWGDVKRTTINIIKGYYQVKPAISMVRNCGFDGSGTHCGKDYYNIQNQEISLDRLFLWGTGLGIANTTINQEGLYNQCLPVDIVGKKATMDKIKHIFIRNVIPLYDIRMKLSIRSRLRKLLSD